MTTQKWIENGMRLYEQGEHDEAAAAYFHRAIILEEGAGTSMLSQSLLTTSAACIMNDSMCQKIFIRCYNGPG